MTKYRVYTAAESNEFEQSRFGYMIERDGTIVALDELQTHGRIVYERHPEARAHYDSLPKDEQNERMTRAELYATETMGFLRISIAPYVGQWSLGTSRTALPLPEQMDALGFLTDVCGVEDMWHDRGEADVRTIRSWITKPNWGL